MDFVISRAIVLVSGGMDSLITASVASSENDEVYFLHVNYGQRTEQKELESFHKICDYYQPKGKKVTAIDYIKDFGGNSLTDTSLEIPSAKASSPLPNTYVPFRNGSLISIACAWAEVIDANKIYIGAVEVDGSGYPDCRSVFFRALETALNYGTKVDFKVEIKTPLIALKKSEIVLLGAKLDTPFELSWSCYRDNYRACGECDSCYLRLKAFKEAGLTDPIPYKSEVVL